MTRDQIAQLTDHQLVEHQLGGAPSNVDEAVADEVTRRLLEARAIKSHYDASVQLAVESALRIAETYPTTAQRLDLDKALASHATDETWEESHDSHAEACATPESLAEDARMEKALEVLEPWATLLEAAEDVTRDLHLEPILLSRKRSPVTDVTLHASGALSRLYALRQAVSNAKA